jgi:hypothetical protein
MALGQLLPPPGAEADWIERVAEHELKLRLGLTDSVPSGWDTPVVSLVPITAPGESVDTRGRDRRPWSVLAVLRSHPVFGPSCRDGKPAIPATIWHDGLDWTKAPWVGFAIGEPLRGLHVGPREYGEQARVLTHTEVIRKHFARVPERMLGTDGEPVIETSVGLLVPGPTEVSIVRLIGREMNLLDRAGITTNPDYSDYTDERERRRLALKVLRLAGTPAVARAIGLPARTVRRFLGTGKTSRARWTAYMKAPTTIADEGLVSLERALPASEEARWRLYMREGRRCRRCGAVLTGKQRKLCSMCRMGRGGREGRGRDGRETGTGARETPGRPSRGGGRRSKKGERRSTASDQGIGATGRRANVRAEPVMGAFLTVRRAHPATLAGVRLPVSELVCPRCSFTTVGASGAQTATSWRS